MVWRDTHDDNNWDTELLKLIEQTSTTGKFMFCSLYCSNDLIIINNIDKYERCSISNIELSDNNSWSSKKTIICNQCGSTDYKAGVIRGLLLLENIGSEWSGRKIYLNPKTEFPAIYSKHSVSRELEPASNWVLLLECFRGLVCINRCYRPWEQKQILYYYEPLSFAVGQLKIGW